MGASLAHKFTPDEVPTRRAYQGLKPSVVSPVVPPAGPASSSSSQGVRFDTTRFPLVVIELPVSPTIEAHRALFDQCNALAARGERYGYVVDMRKTNPFAISASSRQEAARMASEKIDVRRAATICEARVIEHPLMRGITVAFDWAVGHHWPTATFATLAQAEEWVTSKIRADKQR